MISNPNDGIIYAALVLSALAAIMTVHTNSGAVSDKLQWLLMRDGTSEVTMIAGAIGERTTFPVSP